MLEINPQIKEDIERQLNQFYGLDKLNTWSYEDIGVIIKLLSVYRSILRRGIK